MDPLTTIWSVMWNYVSIRVASVALVRDYELFQTDRSTHVDVYSTPSALLGDILRLTAGDFPPLPAVILVHPLPIHLYVSEPMLLKFFLASLAELP